MPTLTTSPATAADLRTRAKRQTGRSVACLSVAAIALAGCGLPLSGTSAADNPEVRPSELTDADGRPCPKKLPIGEDPSGHGFGTEEVADEAPTLLEPEEAWVCRYNSVDVGTTTNGGAIYGWRRAGQPEPVSAADLAGLRDALDDLAPADRSRGCTADLGPRWLVVYSHDDDLTGVLVDDYGCRDVRLTDDPRSTPPGADNQDGTVGGVLEGGSAILGALGIGRAS